MVLLMNNEDPELERRDQSGVGVSFGYGGADRAYEGPY